MTGQGGRPGRAPGGEGTGETDMAFDAVAAEIIAPNQSVIMAEPARETVQPDLFPDHFADHFAAARPLDPANAAADPERALARLFVSPEPGPALAALLAA